MLINGQPKSQTEAFFPCLLPAGEQVAFEVPGAEREPGPLSLCWPGRMRCDRAPFKPPDKLV